MSQRLTICHNGRQFLSRVSSFAGGGTIWKECKLLSLKKYGIYFCYKKNQNWFKKVSISVIPFQTELIEETAPFRGLITH